MKHYIMWKVQKNLKMLVLITLKFWTFGIIDRKPFDIEDLAFGVLQLPKDLYSKNLMLWRLMRSIVTGKSHTKTHKA